jgi:hypothetical protein
MQRLVPELQKVVGRYARTRKDILSDFPEPIPMLAPLAGTVGSIPDFWNLTKCLAPAYRLSDDRDAPASQLGGLLSLRMIPGPCGS